MRRALEMRIVEANEPAPELVQQGLRMLMKIELATPEGQARFAKHFSPDKEQD